MMYLIVHLFGWLLLTAAFAAVAGWAFAARRAQPAEASLRRERDGLMRDLRAISAENAASGGGVPSEIERELDTLRRRADLDAARITEMTRALANARDRAQEAQGRVAELERSAGRTQADSDELARLREEAARTSNAQHVAAAPAAEETQLQDWRLRYFEQRVRYLESQARESAPAPVAAPEPAAVVAAADPSWEWRARTAEARTAHLEEELRASAGAARAEPALEPAAADEGPFAANAQTDMLLRWRLLYLEKRVAHLQGERHGAAPEALATAMAAEEAEKWKWRVRYLEARTRHLEQQLAAAPSAQPAAELSAAPAPEIEAAPEPAPAPAQPAVTPERPAGLAAPRGGLPDDLTLIDGVSGIQQTTLNALGIFHFEQIAAWTPENVAWIDRYLRLRGRIAEEEWIEQAQDLAEHGLDALHRVTEDQDA